MRFLCFLFLLVFAAAVGGFVYFNRQDVAIKFLEWQVTASIAAVVGVAYGLGMLSGWTVVGMLRRSIQRVAEGPSERREYVVTR